MPNITGTLGSLQLETFTIPFAESPIENAVDIITLDGTLYTDFINKSREWTLNWAMLHEDDYNALKTIYDTQFTSGQYPVFELPYYSINVPVRMYINSKDVRRDGCNIMNVNVRLREQYATGFAPENLLLDSGEDLLLENNELLLL